jgi:GMP synthase (glutamine-hydrolysing)
VVEPLAELYKVEVRELGERLGVPRETIGRHPFPGPGLGVRLLCSEGRADREHLGEIAPALAAVSERFGIPAMALAIKSVGVKADLRSYEHPVLLGGECAWERLLEMAGTIFSDVPHINRCIWWMGNRLPQSVTPLAATITQPRLDLLREADAAVMDGLRRHGIYDQIWQCPTVLVPVAVDGRGRELVIIRPIRSERAMTATPAPLPPSLVAELKRSILSLEGVCGLALDVTTKPPGTIEWE